MRAARTAMLLLALVACSSTAPETGSRPAPVAPAKPVTAAEPEPPPPVLSLADVLELSTTAPVNRAARAAVERAAGNLTQAGLSPNPSLQLGVDRIPVDDISEGPLRFNIRAFQWIETAGKRSKRTAVAEERLKEAEWEERIVNITIARTAAGAHQEAVATDRLLAIRKESLRTAEELLELIASRVAAGREPESAVPPAQVRVGRLRIALEDERSRRRRALADLAAVLSLPAGSVTGVNGELLLPADLPGEAGEANPKIGRQRAAVRAEQVRRESAGAKKYPNVGVGIGYEYQDLQDAGTFDSFGFYFEVPLPFFDRNQGEIRESVAAARRAEELTEVERRRVAAEYAMTLDLIRSGMANLASWRESVLPAVRRDRELKSAAFDAGRTTREDVLAVRLAELESLAAAVTEEAKLAALTLDALALLGRPPEQWR